MLKFKPWTGVGLLMLAVGAVALTPKSANGLPWNDAWVALLLFGVGPAGLVALALSSRALTGRAGAAVVAAVAAYLVGVVLFVILGVNLGVIQP
jgi:hypothetical protein